MLLDRQISAHTQTVAVSFIYCLQCFPSSVCVEQITGWMDGWMGDQSIEQCCCCCCCCCRIIDCLWSESAGEGVERSRAPVEHLRWATPSHAFATIGCKPADIASGNEERERERELSPVTITNINRCRRLISSSDLCAQQPTPDRAN